MNTSFIQANTNGRLHPADEPSLSPLNRGFLYGDAIYEVWRTYHGTIFAWEEHFTRLEASARALHMTLPFDRAAGLAEVARTVAAFRAARAFGGDIYVRMQISRGSGPIGLDIALADQPEYVLLVQACPAVAPDKVTHGLKLSIATGLRRNPVESLNPAWKTGNYLNNILGLREARARGADEVLMLNHEGEITEAAVSNIAFVRNGIVITPPLEVGILAGVTRRLLIEKIAPAAGVSIWEEVLHPRDLAGMQECFLLSTTKGIIAVASIDDVTFPVGESTTTTRLKSALSEYATAYAVAHPELKV